VPAFKNAAPGRARGAGALAIPSPVCQRGERALGIVPARGLVIFHGKVTGWTDPRLIAVVLTVVMVALYVAFHGPATRPGPSPHRHREPRAVTTPEPAADDERLVQHLLDVEAEGQGVAGR
jgi:hypothetical protein